MAKGAHDGAGEGADDLTRTIRKLNPANRIDIHHETGARLARTFGDTDESGVRGARWRKHYEGANSELQDHEIEMLREAALHDVAHVAKFVTIEQITERELTRHPRDPRPTPVKQTTRIVMRDYGLDLADWQRLLQRSKAREWGDPQFALAVLRGIWRALLAMKKPGAGMIHGDLKIDNVALPIVPGSLKLTAGREAVRLTLDVEGLCLIDLGWALSSEPHKRRPLKVDGALQWPTGSYLSRRLTDAYGKAAATDPSDTRDLQRIDWLVDIHGLAVIARGWAEGIQRVGRYTNTAAHDALCELAALWRDVHDGKRPEPDCAVVEALIAHALNGEDKGRRVEVEIDLLALADGDPGLARNYADLIEPAPVQTAKAQNGVAAEGGSAAKAAVARPARESPATLKQRVSAVATSPIDKPADNCPALIALPTGSFVMGSPPGEPGRFTNEGPQRTITINRAIAVAPYPVTQAEWRAVMGDNPSRFGGNDNNPVERVSWNDAQEYINRLNASTGNWYGYRLLTEAEWEYAARAGSTTRYCYGDDEAQLVNYAWYSENSKGRTQPVGRKQPNAWGLYDMHGNVWEWVQDCYESRYSANRSQMAHESSDASNRVLRGGSWNYNAQNLRSSIRYNSAPEYRYDNVGFRIARTLF